MSDTSLAQPTTESVVLDMLRENTGRHFLDSGDAYGRHWQRNQSVDFSTAPPTTLSFKYGIEVTHNLHAWLPERLSYEAEADAAWLEWAQARDGEAWLQSAERWVEILGGTGIYGDGRPLTVNTYNGEDLLSQTIQYVYFTLDSPRALPSPGSEHHYERDLDDDADYEGVILSAGTYALLQIHGGADVRGGYTKPRLFSLAEYDETAILDNARATIVCSADHGHNWSTDDANHWYFDGSTGHTELQEYDRVEVAFTDPEDENAVLAELADQRVGKLVIDTEKDTGYCPRCGVGTLSAGA